MKVGFIASPATVQSVVDNGFGALPTGTEVLLKEAVPGAFADLGVQAAALTEAPQDVLELHEQPAGADGQPRAFLVPSELAEPFPVLAYRGVPPRGQGGMRRRRGRRSPKRVVASIAALALAGVVAAAALNSLAENERTERSDGTPAPRSGPTGAKANRDEGRRGVPRSPVVEQSRAVGSPTAGSLLNGIPLPADGERFFTWNVPGAKSPNDRFRRFGTAAVIERVQDVISAYARARPQAPRVGVADLSLPRGGKFGVEFGGSGHLSHQNGLEVDILYPRADGEERAVTAATEADRALTQDLLDRFVEAGAAVIFVDPALGLRGEPSIVRPRPLHEEHMHIRFPSG